MSIQANGFKLAATDFLLQVWILPHLTPITLPIIHITQTGSVYTVIIDKFKPMRWDIA